MRVWHGYIYIRDNRRKRYCAKININKKRYSKSFYSMAEAEAYLEALNDIGVAENLPFR